MTPSTIAFIDAPSPAPDLDYTGRVVKVGFEADAETPMGGEWMWVQVYQQYDDGTLRGMLLNEPITVAGLRYGDEVEGFTARHIYEAEPLS